MPVYDKNGISLLKVYDANGLELDYAYDANGNIVYQKSSQKTFRLKIMTYNVGQWYIGNSNPAPTAYENAYYELQNGMIKRNNADILFLNEYRNSLSMSGLSALEMLQQYYPYIQTQKGGSDGGYSGRAICSKYPITNYVADSGTNYCDTATVTIDGKEFNVAVIHLSTALEARITKFDSIIEKLVKFKNLIFGGDFNPLTLRTADVMEESDDYRNIVKPLSDNGFNSANWSKFGHLITYLDDANGHNWPGALDSIVTSSDLSIHSAYVDTTKLNDGISDKTDHMPLIAEVLVNIPKENIRLVNSVMSFGDNNKLNFLFDIPESELNNTIVKVNDTSYLAKDISPDDNGYLRFSAPIGYKEMRDDVTIAITDNNGNAKNFIADDRLVSSYTTTAEAYFNKVRATEPEGSAYLNFINKYDSAGKYLQKFMDYKVDTIGELDPVDTVDSTDLDDYKATSEGTATGYAFSAISLNITSNIRVSFYSTFTGYSSSDYTMVMDGSVVTADSNGTYVSGERSLTDFDTPVIGSITNKEVGDTMTFSYYVLTYLRSIIRRPASTDQYNMAASMYWMWMAYKDYMAE